MSEVDAFLESTLPELIAAETAIHNGDNRRRIALWSRHDPLTLFGAARNSQGWDGVHAIFEWMGSRFSNCTSYELEVVAAGASGELAYIVAIERTTASVGGEPPSSYALRSTTIFRHEEGEWKVVHRHGDPFDPSSAQTVSKLDPPSTP